MCSGVVLCVFLVRSLVSFRSVLGGRGGGDHQKPLESGPLVAYPTVLVSDSTG